VKNKFFYKPQNSTGGKAMLVFKILKTVVLLFIFAFILQLMSNVFANDCQSETPISTEPGNRIIPSNWRYPYKPKIYWDNDEIARKDYVNVWVDSEDRACPTYSWSVSGTGFHFDSASGPTTATTNADLEKLQLWADGTACGPATIIVTDLCEGNDEQYVRCTNGHWVLVENISCGTLDCCGGTCFSEFYCIQGKYRYMDSWVGGNLMGTRWHPAGNCVKYPCTPYTTDHCYDPGYYPPMYHVGIYSKKKWEWDCP
jgi:hypothetical protein